MLRRELLVGYLVADVLAIAVPSSVYDVVFVSGHGALTTMSTNFPPFRTVRRGLDPEQVEATVRELTAALDAARREAADRTVELAKAQAAHAELTGRLKLRPRT